MRYRSKKDNPKIPEVWQFVTLLRRSYGTMLLWKAKTSPYHGTFLRLKA